MRNIVLLLLVLMGAGVAGPAQARDALMHMSIAEAMDAAEAKARLRQDIAFIFGEQPDGSVKTHLGEYGTSKRTRSINRSASDACNWVFLTAMLELQKRAETLGANAVVNIRSNWRNDESSSTTTFVCAKGGIIAGVALLAEFVILE